MDLHDSADRYTLAPMPRRRICFFIDEQLGEGLKVLKTRVGIPEAEGIRRAIAEYLKGQGVDVEGSKTGRKRAVTRKRP